MHLKSVVRNEVTLYIASAITLLCLFAAMGATFGGTPSSAAVRHEPFQKIGSPIPSAGLVAK